MKLFRINQNNNAPFKVVNKKVVKLNNDDNAFNPFVNGSNSNNTVKQSNLLLELKNNQSKNVYNNAFLAAAIKRDPYAVMGLTTQIRIA